MKKWTFLNTWDEWHAFVIGWCEVIYPFRSSRRYYLSTILLTEYHYYVFGRAIGMLTWLAIGIGIWRLA